MEDDEDLNIISLSCLFGEDFLHEELEHLKDAELESSDGETCGEDIRDVEAAPAVDKSQDMRKKSIHNLQSVMRNKLFKMRLISS